MLDWIIQSEATLQETPELEEKQTENMQFEEAPLEETDMYDSLRDDTYAEDEDEAAHLGKFLSRPVLIQTFSWSMTDTFYNNPAWNVQPWYAYFSDPKIVNKTKNFSRMHGKLHLKWVFNASPFYYGAMRACYEPCKDFQVDYNSPYALIPSSQTPGVWIIPQSESTAEMVLPFLHPLNWIDPLSVSDLQGMGTLRYMLYDRLRSANGASGGTVTISLYAWMDDVQLSGLTTNETVQSQPKGAISGLLDKTTQLADTVSSLPIVGTYASALGAGARIGSRIASAFGFSNEPVTEDVKPVQTKSFHAFANVETSMPIDRLCIDPKNEVTTDLAVTGSEDDDPLALSNFLRESYFGSFSWLSSTAAEQTLADICVTPAYDIFYSSGGVTTRWNTPLSWTAKMFEMWRGSLIYRFKVVASPYHKGRMRISWDPNQYHGGTADNETTTFCKVVDLSIGDDFEFEVPFKHKRMFARTVPTVWSEHTSDPVTNNGYLNIRVQNVLTAPISPAPVIVMCFVRPGADFQFAQPKDLSNYTLFNVQSTPAIDGSVEKKGEHIKDITFGESIRSLRPLIHRASLSTIQVLGSERTTTDSNLPAGLICSTNFMPRLPLMFGYDTNAFNWADSTLHPTYSAPFNWCKTHPITWVLLPFVGNRGSVNLHANIIGGDTAHGHKIESSSLERTTGSPIYFPTKQWRNRASYSLNGGSSLPARACVNYDGYTTLTSGQRGMTLTKEVTQSALSANLPQYFPFRFSMNNFFKPWECAAPNGTYSVTSMFRLDSKFVLDSDATSLNQLPHVEFYYSAGVDFQPVFFVCIPPVLSYDTIPIAVDIATPTPVPP